MENGKKKLKFVDKLEDFIWLRAIRDGMILAIPVILVGSICLLLSTIPLGWFPTLQAIQRSEAVFGVLQLITNSTMNILALVLLITISYSYAKIKQVENRAMLPVVTLCSYIMFSFNTDNVLSMDIFQSAWQLNAILFAITCSVLYVFFLNFLKEKLKRYAESANILFNSTMQSILPVFLVVLTFLVIKVILFLVFGVSNIQTILSEFMYKLFANMPNTFLTGLLFVFLKQVMWFFGIHGSHVLDYTYYVEICKDQTLVGASNPSTQIFCEPFFSNFVFFGGCGSLLCMCIAILLFTQKKKNHMKQISKFAAIPLLFNINELLLFGFPVVFNPTLLLPFILVPCVIMTTTYAAMYLGIVPIVTEHIGWTIPVVASGYLGTGSINGALLQLFNLGIGILIYKPFILRYESRLGSAKGKKVRELEEYMKQCEEQGCKPKLQDYDICVILKKELEQDLKNKKIQMYYQPQVNSVGKVLGAEALLRWNLSEVGFVYPPLVIALAQEANLTQDLNKYIINVVCENVEQIKDLEEGLEFSFNISAEQLSTPFIVEDIRKIKDGYCYGKHNLGLEITEQTALQSSKEVSERITKIRDMGIRIIMDDFGMGHSSLVYLKDNDFDLVKIDGSLVKNLTENVRCADIISSIMQLSNSLGFEVLAEYVETEEQKENLKNLKCNNYQGYLYSKPIPFAELVRFIEQETKVGETKTQE